MNHTSDEIKEWIEKAKSDLLSARILIEHDPPVLETASFHCQQAVEKALKAFLIWKTVPFDKVHSLVYLLDICEVEEPGFASLREGAETLAPYAVTVRYPGKVMEVSPEDAQEALVIAEAVWDFVLTLLPSELCLSFEKDP